MSRPPRAQSLALFALVLLLAPLASGADLNSEIRSVLQDKLLGKAQVSISVVHMGADAASCSSIFKHESDIPLIPASNLKLVTTSAALDRLGPDFKFRTAFVRRGDDLILVGDGDPTFGDAA